MARISKEQAKIKWMLGELTLGDLREISSFDEFSMGQHWYPVRKVLIVKGCVRVFMSSDGHSSMSVPRDRKIKLVDGIARFKVKQGEALLAYEGEIRIKIAKHPF